MVTLYEWLKRKKEAGCEDRKVTLIYEDFMLKRKRVCIKPMAYGHHGHYMEALTDEDGLNYYMIDYLLKFIEEELLRDYYVTDYSIIDDPYSDKLPGERIAYELVVSEEASPQITIDASLTKNPIINYADLERVCDIWKPLICSDDKKPLEIKKLIVDGPATIIFWSDGTKTVVKCDEDDSPDYEKGILYAALKKLSNKKEYNDILRAIDAWSEFNDFHLSDLFSNLVEVEKPKKSKNLCDSCVAKGCILQTGIVRRHCDFYTAESKVEK